MEKRTRAILVHGTFGDFGTASPWTWDDSDMAKAIVREFPQMSLFRFRWSGFNSQRARYKAALRLARHLGMTLADYEHTFVIAHSHGGNVALQALRESDEGKVTLITLGTPFFLVRFRAIIESVQNSAAIIFGLPYVALMLLEVALLGIDRLPLLILLFVVETIIAGFIVWYLFKHETLTRFAESTKVKLDPIVEWYSGLIHRHRIPLHVIFSPLRDEFYRLFGLISWHSEKASHRWDSVSASLDARVDRIRPIKDYWLAFVLFCVGGAVLLADYIIASQWTMMLSTLPFIAATVVAIVVKLLTAVHVDRFLAASVTHGFYQALYTLGKSGSLRQALVVSFAASDTPAWEPSVAGFIHLRPVGPLRVGLLDRFRHAGVRLRGRIRKKITLWDHSLICSDPTAIGIILDVVRRVQEPGMGCRTGNSRVPELS